MPRDCAPAETAPKTCCGPTSRRNQGAHSAARPSPICSFVPWAARRPLRQTYQQKTFNRRQTLLRRQERVAVWVIR